MGMGGLVRDKIMDSRGGNIVNNVIGSAIRQGKDKHADISTGDYVNSVNKLGVSCNCYALY